MKIIIIFIAVQLCLACSGTIITRQNALKQCPIFNVKCNSIKDVADFPVKIVGQEIEHHCMLNSRGCVNNRTIYIQEKDWMVLGHERCHNYCSREHLISQKVISLPFINPKKFNTD
jgi:hypothetical protein